MSTQSREAGASKRRNDVIDALRGVAILAVMAHHYLVHYTVVDHKRDLVGWHHHYSAQFRLGRLGVEVFFVISGLVIAMTVTRCAGPVDFAVRRFARLFPALAVAAPITFVIGRFGPAEFHRTLADLVASLTFFAQHLGHEYIDGVYWSLTVEVIFYTIIGVSILVLRERFWIGPLLIGLVTGAGKLMGHTFLLGSYWPYFLAGIGAWYILFEKRTRLGGIFLCTAAVLYPLARPTGGIGVDLAIVLPVATMFMLIVVGYQGSNLGLAWIGRRSYSLYLVHNIVGVTLIGRLTRYLPDAVVLFVVFTLMLALSWVLFRLVEEPGKDLVLNLWRRWQSPAVDYRK